MLVPARLKAHPANPSSYSGGARRSRLPFLDTQGLSHLSLLPLAPAHCGSRCPHPARRRRAKIKAGGAAPAVDEQAAIPARARHCSCGSLAGCRAKQRIFYFAEPTSGGRAGQACPAARADTAVGIDASLDFAAVGCVIRFESNRFPGHQAGIAPLWRSTPPRVADPDAALAALQVFKSGLGFVSASFAQLPWSPALGSGVGVGELVPASEAM